MKLIRTKESTPRELVLVNYDEKKEIAQYVDVTNIMVREVKLDEWIALAHGNEIIDSPMVFGFGLHWGSNDMQETSDGQNVVRVMNTILAQSGLSPMQYDESYNSHFSPDIPERKIADVLSSTILDGVKERMRAYEIKLMYSY